MRYSLLIASLVLATLISILLVVPSSAAAVEDEIIIDFLEADYKGQYFVMHTPQVNRKNYVFPAIKNPYNGNVDNPPTLSAITLLGYPNSGPVVWKEGYIYTFNYTVAVGLISNDVIPEITFGIATLLDDYSAISDYTALSDVTYTYNMNGTDSSGYTATYSITAVVKVDDSFNNGGIEDYNNTFLALTIRNVFMHSSSNVTVLANRMKMTKAIGEDAYYQASLDAIENLPKSEYDYIYNSMPDETGEVETIYGDFLDILSVFDSDIEALSALLNTQVARPCVYLPSVVIPFMDIEVWDSHIFYVDDYLNEMNPNIMGSLDAMLYLIRTVALFTFVTVGLYRMIRLEWWV